jgi:SulP family sulfate permease
MLLILVAFSGIVGQVALPTLAAVLIYAAVGSLRTAEIATIWRTGGISQVAIVTTFAATLVLPIAAAVGIGVALSLLLQLNREALDLTVFELVPLADGRFEERAAPPTLASRRVILLDVYGSLYYAGARTLQARLPDPTGSEAPAVVLRLRHRTALGATFVVVMADYASRIAAVGGKLYLSGVDPVLLRRFERTHRVDLHGPVSIFEATSVVGESSLSAVRDAEAWLVRRGSEPEDET